jgi:hypothetical protein
MRATYWPLQKVSHEIAHCLREGMRCVDGDTRQKPLNSMFMPSKIQRMSSENGSSSSVESSD